MSASAHIKLVFQKVDARFNVIRVKPSEILDSFLAHGWRLLLKGQNEIECRIAPEPQSFNDIKVSGTPDQVLRAIREREKGMASVSICVWWEATDLGGYLTIEEPTQQLILSMQTRSSWKLLPGYEGFTDSTWFLPKLMDPLQKLDLGVAEVIEWWHW